MAISAEPKVGTRFYNEEGISGVVDEILEKTKKVVLRWTCHCIDCGPEDRKNTWSIEEWKIRCTLDE